MCVWRNSGLRARSPDLHIRGDPNFSFHFPLSFFPLKICIFLRLNQDMASEDTSTKTQCQESSTYLCGILTRTHCQREPMDLARHVLASLVDHFLLLPIHLHHHSKFSDVPSTLSYDFQFLVLLNDPLNHDTASKLTKSNTNAGAALLFFTAYQP
ncbi:hypothetical protein CPB83DRAFT_133463 [Crepidotus variabilis]|uniref:Uncharacterized protein n=1 Tax=Crepidotus variabilis TaxID=179855 RepID=A0A9P6E4C0_9AGAR|nr:hypothetical protein CPB83DRAFT_133463 [Crepidotus variabilis]